MIRDILIGLIAVLGYFSMRTLLSPDPEIMRNLKTVVHRGQDDPSQDGDAATVAKVPLKERLVKTLDRLMLRSMLWSKVAKMLHEADMDLHVGEFLLIDLLFGFVGLIVALVMHGGAAFLIVLLALVLPWVFLSSRSEERSRRITNALPDTLGSIASALRGGFSLLQAFDAASRQAKGPLRQEIERMLAETRVGVPLEDALENLAGRAKSKDLVLMITAVQIQRQVGGNLAEVLGRIQQTIQERVRLQSEVRALSAQGRMSAIIIGALPIGLLVMMSFIAPTFMDAMFKESLGHLILIVAAVLEFLGFLALRKLVRIEV